MTRKSPLRRIAAFTLVELLVVIGIIALLISILLPSLNKARQAALDIKCASNLRQLVMAANMYANENRQNYPVPGVIKTALAGVAKPVYIWPYIVDANVIQQHVKYLNLKPVPPLAPSTVTQADLANTDIYPSWSMLPSLLKSVDMQNKLGGSDPDPTFYGPVVSSNDYYGGYYYYNTGYMYFGPANAGSFFDMTPLTSPKYTYEKIQHPEDFTAKTGHRGVLWSDMVYFYGVAGTNNWNFSHGKNGPARNNSEITAIRGQHVAWSDGSVIWTRIAGASALTKTDPTLLNTASINYNNNVYYWATVDR